MPWEHRSPSAGSRPRRAADLRCPWRPAGLAVARTAGTLGLLDWLGGVPEVLAHVLGRGSLELGDPVRAYWDARTATDTNRRITSRRTDTVPRPHTPPACPCSRTGFQGIQAGEPARGRDGRAADPMMRTPPGSWERSGAWDPGPPGRGMAALRTGCRPDDSRPSTWPGRPRPHGPAMQAGVVRLITSHPGASVLGTAFGGRPETNMMSLSTYEFRRAYGESVGLGIPSADDRQMARPAASGEQHAMESRSRGEAPSGCPLLHDPVHLAAQPRLRARTAGARAGVRPGRGSGGDDQSWRRGRLRLAAPGEWSGRHRRRGAHARAARESGGHAARGGRSDGAVQPLRHLHSRGQRRS